MEMRCDPTQIKVVMHEAFHVQTLRDKPILQTPDPGSEGSEATRKEYVESVGLVFSCLLPEN